MNEGAKPNSSEGSQFHQPPQVPSCSAHQLPKKSATKLISTITPGQRILFRVVKELENCFISKKFIVKTERSVIEEKRDRYNINGWYLFSAFKRSRLI
jgi:hypothetical protein